MKPLMSKKCISLFETKNEKHKMNKEQIDSISKHFANEIAFFNFTFMQK